LAFAYGSITPEAERLQRPANFTGSSVGVYMGDYMGNGQDFYYTKSEISMFVDFAQDASMRGDSAEIEFRSHQTQRSNCIDGCGFSGFATIDFSADGEITDDGRLVITHIDGLGLNRKDQFTIDVYGDEGHVIGGTWHMKEMGANHPIYSGSKGSMREYIAAFGVFKD
jgi:hypothetical protein